MAFDEQYEVLEAVEDDARRLLNDHIERREHWYYHDYIPWERGENFRDKPWDPSQCTISEAARSALVLNLLTEDNLPYYHMVFANRVAEGSAFADWGQRWTAEENQHAIAMRTYLTVSRNCDPKALEDDRLATMTTGWNPEFHTPAQLLSYTSIQELATRVSHRNAGRLADDEDAFQIMKLVALDENHHFIFYKRVLAAMLKVSPTSTLDCIYHTLTNFQMPGFAMPRFLRRSVQAARAGVYNMRLHHDRVIVPVLRDWGIGNIMGMDARGEELQDKIMEFPATIAEQADKFEARYANAS